MCRLCDPHGPEDYVTDTPEDAARFERRRGSRRVDPDVPTRAEAAADEAQDEAERRLRRRARGD